MMQQRTSSLPGSWTEELDARYRGALCAFFRRRIGNGAEAEELAQEVIVRVCDLPEGQMERPDSYVFTIAANLLRDRARRDAVRASYREAILADSDRWDVERRDPERILAGRQNLANVAGALRALPERTRVIFVLYRLEGMPRRDIADAFGISVSAVEKHIANAMRAIIALKENDQWHS